MEEKMREKITNSKDVRLISSIFKLLNESTPYAVLRNYEGLPNQNKSRDIDIIIARNDYKQIKNNLIALFEQQDWTIINYLNSDRLITYVCAYFDGEHTYIIQWDFFFHTSVFGIQLMSAKEFLKDRQFNGFLYHVSRDNEFLDKYLYNRAVGSNYPEKYKAIRKDIENNEIIKNKLKKVYNVNSTIECDKRNSKRLLLQAFMANLLHNPFSTIYNTIFFLYTFIANYTRSNTGFSIGFTGPDGSGKTTIIELIQKQLAPIFGSATSYYHFRPAIIPNAGEAAHNAGLKKEVDREYEKPHRGEKTGVISSTLRLLYYSVDYIIGYFIKVKTKCRITRLVIFDRYYTDIIADSRRSRIYLNYKFLYWFGKLFISSLNYNILLTADTDIILQRKQELNREEIETINNKLYYLKGKKGYYFTTNNEKPEDAVKNILEYVFNEQHKKNLKRLRQR